MQYLAFAITIALGVSSFSFATAVRAASAKASGSPHLSLGQTSTFSVQGVSVPGANFQGVSIPVTPAKYDKVMVRRFGSPSATNVLILVPGTVAGAGDFDIVGPYLAAHVPNLQVWAEMRREGALEDNSMLLKVLHGKATPEQAFDYYLDWLVNPKITNHYQPLKDANYQFADQWGLAVAMGDLHNVVDLARDGGRRTVILGGHSLGGAEASIYAVWDFGGRPGYEDLGGIVGIDGDAGPVSTGFFGQAPVTTASQAQAELSKLAAGSPWLDLMGLGLPWITGPFAEFGALATLKEPNSPSIMQSSNILPAELKPPVLPTNEAQFGYAFDAATSPSALALIHVHSGRLAASGTPRGWVDDGPTPIEDVAFDFAQEPLGPVDWYYPDRLTIDVGAAGSLTQTPAATVLGLRLYHLSQVDVPMYVIQTSLGGTDNFVADAAIAYQKASQIPSVMVVSRASTYSHLDPLLAAPSHNAFLQSVVPWIEQLPSYKR
jgi:hypothetical protein